MRAQCELQVITSNIGGNRHFRRTPIDPHRIAREVSEMLPINRLQPAILAVQEVSNVQFSGEPVRETGTQLARELGPKYRSYYASEIDSQTYPQRRAWNDATYFGTAHVAEGNGIVTNLPIEVWPWQSASRNHPGHLRVSPIQTTISRATLYTTGDRNTQPRNLLVAPISTPFGSVFFMATHLATLSHDEGKTGSSGTGGHSASQERYFQAEQILGVVRQLRTAEDERNLRSRPIILAGDFNAQPSSPEMQLLTSTFTLLEPQPTGDLRWTHMRHEIWVDHILLSDPLNVLGDPYACFIYQGKEVAEVTDHFPVAAIFRK